MNIVKLLSFAFCFGTVITASAVIDYTQYNDKDLNNRQAALQAAIQSLNNSLDVSSTIIQSQLTAYREGVQCDKQSPTKTSRRHDNSQQVVSQVYARINICRGDIRKDREVCDDVDHEHNRLPPCRKCESSQLRLCEEGHHI